MIQSMQQVNKVKNTVNNTTITIIIIIIIIITEYSYNYKDKESSNKVKFRLSEIHWRNH